MLNDNRCFVCNQCFEQVARHVIQVHPKETEEQNALVLKYYQEGFSAAKIAKMPDIMYNGATSIVRMLNKTFTKEQLEAGRRERIGSTRAEEFASGNYDWINDINTVRLKTDEARQKNSEGLKKAYAEGRRTTKLRPKLDNQEQE